MDEPQDPTVTTPASLTVGMREFRQDMAAMLRRAHAGDRIVVTVDGAPTAQLVPLGPGPKMTLADLAAAGMIDPPRRREHPAVPEPAHLPVDADAASVVEELRGR